MASIKRALKSDQSPVAPTFSSTASGSKMSCVHLPLQKALLVSDGLNVKLIKDSNGVYPLNGIFQVLLRVPCLFGGLLCWFTY
jgi:hypothetical protein